MMMMMMMMMMRIHNDELGKAIFWILHTQQFPPHIPISSSPFDFGRMRMIMMMMTMLMMRTMIMSMMMIVMMIMIQHLLPLVR